MDIGLFCKSFHDDLDRLLNLVKSIKKFNKDNIPLVVAVPPHEKDHFREALPSWVEVIDEEVLIRRDINKKLPPWRDQQLVKFMFGVDGPFENYVVLDSDCEFIRSFYIHDFLGTEGKIPLVATNKNYRYVQGDKFSLEMALGKITAPTLDHRDIMFFSNKFFSIDRSMIDNMEILSLKPFETEILVNQTFGRRDQKYIYFLPTPIILSRKIVTSFWTMLRGKGLSFSDLLLYAPWEALWYGNYAVSRFRPEIQLVEPFAMHYIKDADIKEAKSKGVSRKTMAKNFLCVTLAARHQEAIRF